LGDRNMKKRREKEGKCKKGRKGRKEEMASRSVK
jgi:hypothetical protein